MRSTVHNGTDDIHPYSRFPAFHSMSIFVASEGKQSTVNCGEQGCLLSAEDSFHRDIADSP